ncbi:MAG: hypothetical protein E6R02_08395 [Gammaproteobacteria bacterium]|nr:MAG: hypothetical protein E6R02_08395 [Gammaproteobacteria bacterium]
MRFFLLLFSTIPLAASGNEYMTLICDGTTFEHGANSIKSMYRTEKTFHLKSGRVEDLRCFHWSQELIVCGKNVLELKDSAMPYNSGPWKYIKIDRELGNIIEESGIRGNDSKDKDRLAFSGTCRKLRTNKF